VSLPLAVPAALRYQARPPPQTLPCLLQLRSFRLVAHARMHQMRLQAEAAHENKDTDNFVIGEPG
jgi:hypothetical protein